MRSHYPISDPHRKPSWINRAAKHPKNAAHLKCCLCDQPAIYQVWVQVDWFRGNDEGPFKACKEHKDNASELLATKVHK